MDPGIYDPGPTSATAGAAPSAGATTTSAAMSTAPARPLVVSPALGAYPVGLALLWP